MGIIDYPLFHPDIFKMGYFPVYLNEGGFISSQITKEQLEEGHSQETSQYTHVEVSGGGFESVLVKWPRAKTIDIRKVHSARYVKLVKYIALDYDTKRYKVAYWSMSDRGKWYSLRSLLWWKLKDLPILNKILHKRLFPAGLFCAYSCARALARQYKLHKRPDEFMPADFLNDKYFKIVWEGFIP